MSTKAKIGKDWVKAQVVLLDGGETLHLTFAPGETGKKVTLHIDGATVVGELRLEGLEFGAPHDATLKLHIPAHVRAVAPAVVAKAAVVEAPVAVVPAPEIKAPVAVKEPAPVVTEAASVEGRGGRRSGK